MSDDRKLYRSFISYSQKDKAWGRRIHTWLETYRVPVGVMAAIEPTRRLGRFFRDEEEMPAADNIATVVSKAIKSAESQIVICSPRSAQSKWVEAEIRHFRATNPEGKVFAVIIDGAPNSGDPATECFPPALRAGFNPDRPDLLPIEPMGLDVRVDGKDRICARLAAGLLNVDFDDLWQRDRRRSDQRQRRAMIGMASTSLMFALLASAALWFGFAAQTNAKEARRQQAIATARSEEAIAARRDLQHEYLTMLGEAAVNEVLSRDAEPGTLTLQDQSAFTVLMQQRGAPFAVARDFGDGRVLVVAHDKVLNGVASGRSEGFLRRTLAWLKGARGPQAVLISAGHCEWLPNDSPDWALPELMQRWGYEVRVTNDPLHAAALADVGVLIIGNAWGNFSDEERAAVERFVGAGGGVLLAGLGWSWQQSSTEPDMGCPGQTAGQDVSNMATYPMNRLAAPFGVQWPQD